MQNALDFAMGYDERDIPKAFTMRQAIPLINQGRMYVSVCIIFVLLLPEHVTWLN